ncbi:MAG: lactonase family protein [Planctomycetota bacterium]|jgi:6-phosphogluconolactonase
MKLNLFYALIATLLVSLGGSDTLAAQRLYLSAGNTITVFNITDDGALEELQKLELDGAGPTTLSPNQDFLYAVANGPAAPRGQARKSALATFRVLDDGVLSQVNHAPANLRPGYLATDASGSYITGNHYGQGKVTVWKLERGVYKGQTVQELDLELKAHSTVFSPDNRFLLVPATGPNKVFQNRFDAATGWLTPHTTPHASGPPNDNDARQPRHLIFHPDGQTVYTTLEREHAGVGVWRWDAARGTLRVVQNIITEPVGFTGYITTADLHLTPDSKFLYISNRDTTTRGAPKGDDTIVGFKVDPLNQRLTLIGHTPAPRVPRSFAISKNGKFLFAAGQGDDTMFAYRIDPNTGNLTKIAQHPTGANPIWVETVELP